MSVSADNNGVVTCKFTIPEGIPSGRKRVTVVGDSGSFGETYFEGRGEIWQEDRHTNTTVTTTVTELYKRGVGLPWLLRRWYEYPYTWRWNRQLGRWVWGWFNCGWVDPLAQTFRLSRSRQVSAIELHVREKGDTPITVQLRTTQNGIPTNNLLTQTDLLPGEITENTWNTWEFPEPVLLEEEEEYCFVVLCGDADAELSIAELGKWDNTAQKWVTTQAYTVGVLLSSSNASTWTAHQDKDLAFRLLCGTYTFDSREIDLGVVTLDDHTDIALACEHLVPSSNCRVSYTASLPDGRDVTLTPGVGLQLPSPASGDVTLKATMVGESNESPLIAPGAQLIVGKLEETADYVTRAIEGGSGVKVTLVVDAAIPSGATLVAEWRGTEDVNWTEFAPPSSRALSSQWAELVYTENTVTKPMIQVRLALTGTSAARPLVSNLRLYTS